jgi:hypothetical protein
MNVPNLEGNNIESTRFENGIKNGKMDEQSTDIAIGPNSATTTTSTRTTNEQMIKREEESLIQLYEEGMREYKIFSIHMKSLLKEMKLTLQHIIDRDRFVKEYRAFIKQRNILIEDPGRFFVKGFRIDIYELFVEVTSRGGFVQVCGDGAWEMVWRSLIGGADDADETTQSNSNEIVRNDEDSHFFSFETENVLKELYLDFLYPFECFKQGKS